MAMAETRQLRIGIAVPFERAYGFARQPENFPKWAAGMSKSLHRTERGWIADAPQGEALVEFTEPNDFGVLDHRVHIGDAPEIYIPLRMIANGDGTEVVFTLFRQPGMDDAAFAEDVAAVEKDLAALKALLEGGG